MAPQAIILAAGRGRRMQPLSDGCHKALLPIGGTTILARIVEELVTAGVSVIHVVTGYRAADVEAHLRSAFPVAFHFIRNERFATTNNVVSLALALDRADPTEDVLLVECDLLLAPGLLARVAQAEGRNVALLDRYRTGMDGTVVSVADGIVARVFPPHLQDAGFEYRDTFKTLNVYRFSRDFVKRVLGPRVREQVTELDPTSYYEVVLATLPDIAAYRIEAELVQGSHWAEVDDPNDLVSARFLFEPDARADILDTAMGGHWAFDVVDFGFMCNRYFPPEAMLAAMRHSLMDALGTYGSSQAVLNQKLAWFLRCQPGHVEVLHGATQAFPVLRELWQGRSVAIPAPTFGEYARTFPAATTYADAPGVEVNLLARLADETDVLILVNPNNPTGTTVASSTLHALAAEHPSTSFLIDESFIDFSDQPSIRTALDEAPLANVAVLCSLSKSLGVPGLRLGYIYSRDPGLLSAVAERLPIWNLGSLTEYFVELLLKFRPELEASLQQTRRDRAVFRDALLQVPAVANVHPGGGNFLLVELRGDADAARLTRRTLLARASLEVKNVSLRFPDRAARLRIAVRQPAENQRLTDALMDLDVPLTGAPG